MAETFLRRKTTMSTGTRLLHITVLPLFLAAAAAPRAQECVRIESVPQRSTLTVRDVNVVSSVAPAVFCELEPGRSYQLSVSRTSFEKRTLKFSFANFDAPPDFGGIRLGRVGRSMVLPGWGQYSLDYRARGTEAFTTCVIAALKVNQAYRDYSEAKNSYDFFVDLAAESQRQDVIDRANEMALKTSKDVNRFRTNTWVTAALAGWVYAENLFETLLLASAPKAVPSDGTAFSVEIPKRSRPRAVFRSLLFPGLGQKYYGSHSKGLVFRTAFLVLAYYTLDAKLRYDLATVEYQLAFDSYKEAGSVTEIEAARAEAKQRFQEKDDREKDMYVFAAATGAVWFINVLDAVVFGGAGETEDRFAFDTSYKSATVRAGLRVNF